MKRKAFELTKCSFIYMHKLHHGHFVNVKNPEEFGFPSMSPSFPHRTQMMSYSFSSKDFPITNARIKGVLDANS